MKLETITKASIQPILMAMGAFILIMGLSTGLSILMKNSPLSGLIALALSALLDLVNLAIFAYAGFRAGKVFQASALEGGAVSAFSFFVAHTIVTILSVIIVVLTFGSILGAIPASTTQNTGLTAGVIGGAALMLMALQYIVVLLVGLVINFIAGAIGAYFVTRKAS